MCPVLLDQNSYSCDKYGNLNSRHDTSAGRDLKEAFCYDAVNRMSGWNPGSLTLSSNQCSQSFVYDGLGNIKQKSFGGQSYTYHYESQAKPHALTKMQASSSLYDTFTYNSNGDVLVHTQFNQQAQIIKTFAYASFAKVNQLDVQNAEAFTSAALGGTVSKLTGGKFANGAISAIITWAYNDNVDHNVRRQAAQKRITVTQSVDGDYHVYKVRGLICATSTEGCNAAYADKVFTHVNGNDVPFSSEDLGSGNKTLIKGIPRPLGNQPIYHSEDIANRTSVNITLEGHNFHPGDVTHRVHFENGNLYYDMIGTGSGWAPGFNNRVGIKLFGPGVQDAVDRFGM